MTRHKAPTGSNAQSPPRRSTPPALSQKKLQEGYDHIHIAYAVFTGVMGCVAAWHYAYGLPDLTGFERIFRGFGYNAGIIISDMAIWYIIKCFKAGEFAGRDVWKARLTKIIALVDVSVAAACHGSAELASMYFVWMLPAFLFVLFVMFGWLFEGGERLMMLRIEAMAQIGDYMDAIEDMKEQRRDKRALRRERSILANGKRQARIAFAEKISKRIIWKIKTSPFKSVEFGRVADKMIKDMFVDIRKDSSKATAKEKSLNPLIEMSVNYEPGGDGENPKKSKTRRYRNCTCGKKLPKTVIIDGEEKAWNSRYCPELDPLLATYGKPRSACKTAKSRKLA